MVVKYWLSHEQERLARVQASQRWIMQTGGTDAFFADFTQLYLERQRPDSSLVGKVFPYPFYVRCRFAGGEPWCDGERAKHAAATKYPHYHTGARHPSFGGFISAHEAQEQLAHSSLHKMAAPSYQPRWKPLRWLFLRPRSQASVWFDQFRSAVLRSNSDIEVVATWGPGWEGWNVASLETNIRGRWGDAEFFDVIFHTGQDSLTAPYSTLRTVIVTAAYACASAACAARLAGGRPDVVALANPHEMVASSGLNLLSQSSLLVHMPLVGLAEEPPGGQLPHDHDRPIDVVLTRSWATLDQAAQRELLGPLRAEKFEIGLVPPNSTTWNLLHQVLARAKLVLTDTTSRHYWTPEISQALSTGTVVISDTPNENREMFRKCGVELPYRVAAAAQAQGLAPSIHTVGGLVRKWASSEMASARARKSAAGLAWTELQRSTLLGTLVESYYEVLTPPFGEGLVGKKFTSPFVVGCRADGGEAWCD